MLYLLDNRNKSKLSKQWRCWENHNGWIETKIESKLKPRNTSFGNSPTSFIRKYTKICSWNVPVYILPISIRNFPHLADIFMMTQSNGNIFCVIDPLWVESNGHRWIPLTKASDVEFWCFHWSAPEKTESKQSRCRWFETPSRSSWRHRDVAKTDPNKSSSLRAKRRASFENSNPDKIVPL